MKKIQMILALVGIILLSTVTLCYAQRHGTSVIGILRNGVSQITMDQQIIKDKWQSVLKKGGIDMVFTEMSIVDNGDGTYALIGTNADRSITSCIALSLDQNNYYELYTFQGGGLSVSCTGCALGCHPVIKDGQGYCLPLCTPCTKTESTNQQGIF